MRCSIVLGAFLVTGLLACGENSHETTKATGSETASPDGKNCYAYFSPTDTVTLIFSGPDTAIRGSLVYAYAGKDRNLGSIQGRLKGDTLVADYRFHSEGKESVREVVFLRSGNQMKEGFGSVMEQDGKMVFINHAQLSFGDSFVLEAQNCR